MVLIGSFFSQLSMVISSTLPEGILNSLLSEGVLPAVGAIVMFLPNILILFLGLNLLEQSGYISRAAYLLDGFLKRFGLQGKAFVPLVSGFGCTVPAYMAARTLKNPKDRIITMLVLGFMNLWSENCPGLMYLVKILPFFGEVTNKKENGTCLVIQNKAGLILGSLNNGQKI